MEYGLIPSGVIKRGPRLEKSPNWPWRFMANNIELSGGNFQSEHIKLIYIYIYTVWWLTYPSEK